MSKMGSNFLGALLAIFASLALFRLTIFSIQIPNYVEGIQTSLGVTTGYPIWLTYQSRVLAPYIIKIFSFGSEDRFATVHIWFQIINVAIAAFLCWRLGRKHGGDDRSALLAFGLFVMCFALLLSPPYIFSWDFVDIIVFLVFLDLVLTRSSLIWFVGLIAIAVWNRDSAIFIALYLIVDPLARYVYRRWYRLPPAPIEWRQIVSGGICTLACLAIAELLKRSLLIKEIGPELYPNSPITGGNRYNITLLQNIHTVKTSLSTLNYQFEFMILIFLILNLALGARLVRRDPQRYLGFYLVEIALVASLFTFGWFVETRIYLILIPFLVMSSILVTKPK
jgi:hypothetical protein